MQPPQTMYMSINGNNDSACPIGGGRPSNNGHWFRCREDRRGKTSWFEHCDCGAQRFVMREKKHHWREIWSLEAKVQELTDEVHVLRDRVQCAEEDARQAREALEKINGLSNRALRSGRDAYANPLKLLPGGVR